MAKTKEFTFKVITPERKVLEEMTDSVVIPAYDGELGILLDRAPLLCELGVGQLRYHKDGQTRRMLVDSGFAQVTHNNVTVLTSSVLFPEEISEKSIADADAAAERITGNDEMAVEARERARKRASMMRALKAG